MNLFQQASISQLQRQDPRYAPLIEYLENGTLSSDRAQADLLLHTQQDFFLYDNVLYHLWVKSGKGPRLERHGSHVQLVIPTPLVPLVLEEMIALVYVLGCTLIDGVINTSSY